VHPLQITDFIFIRLILNFNEKNYCICRFVW